LFSPRISAAASSPEVEAVAILVQRSGTAVPCLTSKLLEGKDIDQLDPKEEKDIMCVSGVLYAGERFPRHNM
jgi:hypothetical protein